MVRIQEKVAFHVNGFIVLMVELVLLVVGVWLLVASIGSGDIAGLVASIIILLTTALLISGFFTVQPNEARVLIFWGRYTGSARNDGFWWSNPFTSKQHVSLRVRNFNSDKLKVNDAGGSPIEIAAVVVWRVVESAKALFDVDDYDQFVNIQAETAIRNLATRYPYDAAGESRESLRENPEDVATELKKELQDRLEVAGVEVTEARLTHLAYTPEIAQAMLRRQQAQAIVAAKKLIVEAAVGMVEEALKGLAERGVVDLDYEKRAAMANNLMVVLTSEQASTPVINTGTLYGG